MLNLGRPCSAQHSAAVGTGKSNLRRLLRGVLPHALAAWPDLKVARAVTLVTLPHSEAGMRDMFFPQSAAAAAQLAARAAAAAAAAAHIAADAALAVSALLAVVALPAYHAEAHG